MTTAAKVAADLVAHNQRLAQDLAVQTRLSEARHEETQRALSDNRTALASIAADVKSLLATRSFTRGVWRAAVVAATVVSTLATTVIEFFKWRVHP